MKTRLTGTYPVYRAQWPALRRACRRRCGRAGIFGLAAHSTQSLAAHVGFRTIGFTIRAGASNSRGCSRCWRRVPGCFGDVMDKAIMQVDSFIPIGRCRNTVDLSSTRSGFKTVAEVARLQKWAAFLTVQLRRIGFESGSSSDCAVPNVGRGRAVPGPDIPEFSELGSGFGSLCGRAA